MKTGITTAVGLSHFDINQYEKVTKISCKQEKYFKVPSEPRPHLFLTKMAFSQYKLLCKKVTDTGEI